MWSGNDWTLVMGGAGILLVAVGNFISQMVALRRLGAVVSTVEVVTKQIDGILAQRDATNVAAGERKGKAAGEHTAETLAEGQRQGREMVREEAAKVPALPQAMPGPLPVADDRVAVATEHMADAAEATVPESNPKPRSPKAP